jgi:ABC-type Na+ transport system ATPase subunit NatA
VNTVTATRAATAVAAISARGLRKSFGEKTALDGIDLTVPRGTILALLGPNGAGKTTAVHLLTTYLRPDAGEIRIAGQDPAKNPQAVRHAIGVTGQFSAVDGYLTGRENLMLMADLHLLPRGAGRRRAEELLERFELTEAGDKPASTYSGGMKRKLDLAMTLVGNPKVIFLDKPTTGLDPAADLRRDVAVRRPGAVGQERGNREQLADVPPPAAVPRQRVRPGQLAAGVDPLVRRVRAVHPGERDAARTADRNEDRRQPDHHDRLVRRGRGAVVRLVAAAVRTGAEAALSW